MRLPLSRYRRQILACADCLFLVAVALATTLVMRGAHHLPLWFPLAAMIGMALAMAVQTGMAVSVSPVLGSIESMVPSMIVGMVSPMAECGAHLLGRHLNLGPSLFFGVCIALVLDAHFRQYQRKCHRRYQRVSVQEG